MPLFVVERELPGITPEALQSAGLRAKTCCSQMTAEGEPVRWVRSFLPESERAYCYFEASGREAVQEVNQRAKIPFLRIGEAMEMTPDCV